MDEEIAIIETNTRNERIKNFFVNNKKKIIIILSIIILFVLSIFAYYEFKDKKNKNLAEKYNNIIINFDTLNNEKIRDQLVDIINEKNSTYSPLALYFIIDNELKFSNKEINNFFDILINQVSLDKEIKNLIIFKKALFSSEYESENNLLKILNPILNSDSVWKSHALYLMAEYFFEKEQKQKAKEFYEQILNYKNSNEKIILETQKRLKRDFSE